MAKNLNIKGIRSGFDYGKRAMVQNAANSTGRPSSLRDPAFQEKLKQANISLGETLWEIVSTLDLELLKEVAVPSSTPACVSW